MFPTSEAKPHTSADTAPLRSLPSVRRLHRDAAPPRPTVPAIPHVPNHSPPPHTSSPTTPRFPSVLNPLARAFPLAPAPPYPVLSHRRGRPSRKPPAVALLAPAGTPLSVFRKLAHPLPFHTFLVTIDVACAYRHVRPPASLVNPAYPACPLITRWPANMPRLCVPHFCAVRTK